MEISSTDATKLQQTVDALSALAQEHRLAVFRLLVQSGQKGLAAGDIARRLSISPSSLSFHLNHLKSGNMISSERKGRSIIYRADFVSMNRLMAYLLENCCAEEGCGASESSAKSSATEKFS